MSEQYKKQGYKEVKDWGYTLKSTNKKLANCMRREIAYISCLPRQISTLFGGNQQSWIKNKISINFAISIIIIIAIFSKQVNKSLFIKKKIKF